MKGRMIVILRRLEKMNFLTRSLPGRMSVAPQLKTKRRKTSYMMTMTMTSQPVTAKTMKIQKWEIRIRTHHCNGVTVVQAC